MLLTAKGLRGISAKLAPVSLAKPVLGAYLRDVSSGTMNINALVISGSDPGAVPGVSTKHPSFEDHGDEIGSTNV